jgi:hypothetical protein
MPPAPRAQALCIENGIGGVAAGADTAARAPILFAGEELLHLRNTKRGDRSLTPT